VTWDVTCFRGTFLLSLEGGGDRLCEAVVCGVTLEKTVIVPCTYIKELNVMMVLGLI
jgi:hypothetical protein